MSLCKKDSPVPSENKVGCGRLVIALGNFDGVHAGHGEILKKTVSIAKALSASSAVWMFRPHPSACLTGRPLPLITTFEERKKIFRDFGIDRVVEADFPSFRNMKKEEFLGYLKEELGAVGAVCGYNYSFGEKGSGNASDIVAFFGENAYVLPEMCMGDRKISSTEIRKLILDGDIPTANMLLHRRYFVKGIVEEGRKIGRKMNFPTANITLPEDKLPPAVGIYATETTVDGEKYPSVSNFGSNPTVSDSKSKKLETHIIGFSKDLYGKEICVEFIAKIRNEKKFSGIDELADQIAEDCENAMKLYKEQKEYK